MNNYVVLSFFDVQYCLSIEKKNEVISGGEGHKRVTITMIGYGFDSHSRVPSAHPAVCGIQREAEKKIDW